MEVVEVAAEEENLALPDIPPLHYSLPWPRSLLWRPRRPADTWTGGRGGGGGGHQAHRPAAAKREHTLRGSCWPQAKAWLLPSAPDLHSSSTRRVEYGSSANWAEHSAQWC